jgi:hypothetical protein
VVEIGTKIEEGNFHQSAGISEVSKFVCSPQK